ncbi:MAG TPA: hypothetical protein VF803_03205, partial [Candidatus Paceibacterota bacterium]
MEAPPGSPLMNGLRRWWKLILVTIVPLLALVAGALYYHFADMQFSLVPDSVREFGAHLGAYLMEKKMVIAGTFVGAMIVPAIIVPVFRSRADFQRLAASARGLLGGTRGRKVALVFTVLFVAVWIPVVMWGPEMYEAVASRAHQDANVMVASNDGANRVMPEPRGEPTKAEKDEVDRLLKSHSTSEDKKPEAAPAQVAAASPPKAVVSPPPPPKAMVAVERPSSPAAPVKVAERSARSVQPVQAQALPENAPAGSQLVRDVVCKPPKHRFVDFDRCTPVK